MPPAADPAFAAVIFDMDGAVTDTAGVHAAAWQALFDQVLPTLAASRDVEPFDIEAERATDLPAGKLPCAAARMCHRPLLPWWYS
jgi:hypothetical protein